MSIAQEIEMAARAVKNRILVLDIETSPNVGAIWGLFNQNLGLNQLREVGQVISFGAKWSGDKKTEFYSDYHDGHEVMVQKAWELVNEADIVVHFNGVSFDMKHLKREFLLGGFPPPSPYKDVDLLNVVKKNFRFVSNKLDHVASQLGLGHKVKHTGFDLWNDCLWGDEETKAAAWKLMKKYNKGDVDLTDELYQKLLPWIHNHPHTGVVADAETLTCNRCGSLDLSGVGSYRTQVFDYPLYQCNSCGGYVRSSKNVGRAGNTIGVK